MDLLFLGVGTINSAIIKAICRKDVNPPAVNFPLYLSPRGEKNVAQLAGEYGPEKIHVCSENSELLLKKKVHPRTSPKDQNNGNVQNVAENTDQNVDENTDQDTTTSEPSTQQSLGRPVLILGTRPDQVHQCFQDLWMDVYLKIQTGVIQPRDIHHKLTIVNLVATMRNQELLDILETTLPMKNGEPILKIKLEIIKLNTLPCIQYGEGVTVIAKRMMINNVEGDSGFAMIGSGGQEEFFTNSRTVIINTKSSPTFMLNSLFTFLGGPGSVCECETEDELETLIVASSLMGPIFQQCGWIQKFLGNKLDALDIEKQELAEQKRLQEGKQSGTLLRKTFKVDPKRSELNSAMSKRYVCNLTRNILSEALGSETLGSLGKGGTIKGSSFQALMDAQTKGGLNEQAMSLMGESEPLMQHCLEMIHKRLRRN